MEILGKMNKEQRVSKGPKRNEESHAAILTAAEELLIEGGPAAVSFEAIAKRAKASRATLYRWWPNKLTLLFELHDRQKERDLKQPDCGNLRDDLIAYTKELWSFWRNNNSGAAFAALISEAQLTQDGQTILDKHFNNEETCPYIPCFRTAMERGELIENADIDLLRQTYFATNWFHLLCGRLNDEEIEPTINLLLNGMLR